MSALVRWLPKLAVATADDIAQLGPQAARVRSLLDFIPTMSKDASRATDASGNIAVELGARRELWKAAEDAARAAARLERPRDSAFSVAWIDARDAARDAGTDLAASRAAGAESVSDLISPENYRILTNPLAAGRAVDVLMPRYKDTPFRELLQELVPKRVITQPSDVLGVGRIASLPDEVAIREAIDLVADYGMTFEEALNVIRMV